MNTGKVTILAKNEILRKGFFRWNLVRFQFQRFDGTESEVAEHIVFDRGDSVAVLVHDLARQEVVLVEQLRIATGSWTLEIPAGKLDADEGPEAAAIRELAEETSAVVNKIQSISTFYPSPGACNERIHLFYCPFYEGLTTTRFGGLKSENEDIKVMHMPVAVALDRMSKGEIIDAKTIIALLWLKAQIGST